MSEGTIVERYENAFLGLSAGVLVLFLVALFYAATAMGLSLPSRAGELDPAEVRTTAPFDEPGMRQVGPDRFEVVMIGQAWGFQPSRLTVPAGAEILFRITSVDVLHGFTVEGTRLNAMLIPGQITEVRYTFREPGEHLIICHEYCGIGHHNMYGEIRVVSADEFEMPDAGASVGERTDGEASGTAASASGPGPGPGGGAAGEGGGGST